MNAILICVDYSDLLALTLPRNRHHFNRVMIVTTPGDTDTQRVAAANNAETHLTQSFYSNNAEFSKYKALEEGLDSLGREGWLTIMDADVVWPKSIEMDLEIGNLYTPKRRMMTDLSNLVRDGLPLEETWTTFPLHRQQTEWAGYTQIYHATDPALGPPPWHEIGWRHCGGGDSFFQRKWPTNRKLRPPFEVLHLGSCGENWCGRVSQRLDGSIPTHSAERASQLRGILTRRRDNQSKGIDPYIHERL